MRPGPILLRNLLVPVLGLVEEARQRLAERRRQHRRLEPAHPPLFSELDLVKLCLSLALIHGAGALVHPVAPILLHRIPTLVLHLEDRALLPVLLLPLEQTTHVLLPSGRR